MCQRLRLGVLAAVGVLVVASPVRAQTPLAEVARQERERRATITDEKRSRVYTNDDLVGGPGLTTGTSPQPSDRADTPPDQSERTQADDGAADAEQLEPTEERGETYWRTRIMNARDAKQRAELVAAALQNRVDGLWASFTARDDPIQRAAIEQDRLDALDELSSTQAEIERLDQEIRDIQEEARREGALPGWLR